LITGEKRMEEGEDSGSSFTSSLIYSLGDPDSCEDASYEEAYEQATYNLSVSFNTPPSYMPIEYRAQIKELKTGTQPKTGLTKIEEALDLEENPFLLEED
jgi:hypothetical protein